MDQAGTGLEGEGVNGANEGGKKRKLESFPLQFVMRARRQNSTPASSPAAGTQHCILPYELVMEGERAREVCTQLG